MNKFFITFGVIPLCFLMQYSWGMTLQSKEQGPANNNFGWKVYKATVDGVDPSETVTINSLDGQVKSTVNGAVTDLTAEIEDINCIGKTFSKVGDSCKFKARAPYGSKDNADVINYDIKYFFNNDVANLLVYHNHTYKISRLNVGKPIVRFADIDENKQYPALNDTNGSYVVLVVENGGLVPLSLNSMINQSPNVLTLMNQAENKELYGSNTQCSPTDKNQLKSLGGTCIRVYRFANSQSSGTAVPKGTVDVKIDNISNKVIATATVKSMEVVIGSVTKTSNRPSWDFDVSVKNYYGKDNIKATAYVVDANGAYVSGYGAYYRCPTGSWQEGVYNCDTCILGSTNTKCIFSIALSYGRAPASGTYTVKVKYSGNNIEAGELSKSFVND